MMKGDGAYAMKCHHFEDCGNEAIYDLELVDGTTIHVCEDCDEDYGICQVCGKIDLSKNMAFANSEDEYKTCFLCSSLNHTEWCSHCDFENNYENHDVRKDGYVVECTQCHTKIFLCDTCMHSADNPNEHCDWENGKCFRGSVNLEN